MSLRHGVTAQEEHRLKALVSKGKSWEEIAQTLEDVDLPHVKKTIYEPLVKKLEEVKKLGHKDLHSYDRAEAKKRVEAKKAKDEE